MPRHGRCRCGIILEFRRGPQGYKTRCPNCKSVVRLRVGSKPGEVAAQFVPCPCGTAVPDLGTVPLVCPTCKRHLKAAPSSPLAASPAPGREAGLPAPSASPFETDFLPDLFTDRPSAEEAPPSADILPILPDTEEPAAAPAQFQASTVACTTCQTQISSRLLECPACGSPQFPTDLSNFRF
jgi:hypothetical protein